MARVFVVSTLLVIATLTVAAVMIHQALWRPLANPTVELEVKQGASARRVLDQLANRGLLPSRPAGRLYLALWGGERNLRYGHYRIPPDTRPVDVLERILDGAVETERITVAEGLTAAEIIDLFTSAGFGGADDWQNLISRVDLVHDIAPDAPSLEGFLFPDTYDFAVGVSAETITHHMVDRFHQVWHRLTSTVDHQWGSPFDAIVLASMVEAETSVPSERSRIAGVFVNRLRRGMLLQCDPTVVYALQRNGLWEGRLLRRHWLLDDPYNTYRHPGLPPAPINSPGEAALAAALAPEDHSYLYFVARPGGGHTFSKTLNDHNRAVATWRGSRR